MTFLRLLLISAVLTFGGGPAFAQTFPKLTGRIVDAADLLNPAQEAQLTQLSDQIEKASSRQFVVATVSDLQGYPIEDYGYKLGREWKIGQEGANNGIILLVAPKERKVRIEVGYGLEPIMTDALASMIVNQTILPKFRDGDMPGGIIAGADAIGEQMKLPLEAAEQRAQQLVSDRAEDSDDGGGIFVAIFWMCILFFVIFPMIFGRAKGRRYRRGLGPVILWGPASGGWGGGSGGGSSWGGGSFGGGGGFSGGGGSFGGGGASGGW